MEPALGCTVLELFAGIGGLRCAWPEATMVAAVDINENARGVYLQNCEVPYLIREIASMRRDEMADLSADVWWLSPPCQPYCRQGKKLDLADSRAEALTQLLRMIPELLPSAVAVENVPGFEVSRSYDQLLQVLETAGYHHREIQLCPTQLNWPNRRDRFYLLASREALPPWQPFPRYRVGLEQLIDQHISRLDSEALWLTADALARYETAIDRVDLRDTSRICTACFTSSYGKAIVGAGSYLAQADGVRRFAPREVAHMLGFPDSFRLRGLSDRALWRLLGNSLSLPAVRYVISHLPGGPTNRLPWIRETD